MLPNIITFWEVEWGERGDVFVWAQRDLVIITRVKARANILV